VSRKSKLVPIACALALGLAGSSAALAAGPQAQVQAPRMALVSKPADRFEDAIQLHRVERRYRAITAEAKQLVAKAKRIAAQPALAGGVSQATLDAIAACESGGDPTAVNPAGYYGKYQFDMGTWASVGGRGNPAEAPEAEQDYRASLLYSRAGSSPWPVCGQ
jgi:soluble lytic murein transglycosylase-like protein